MTKEEFVKKTATELISGLLQRADEILDEGTPVLVRYAVDATSIYGEGWHFAINVKWVKEYRKYFMELAAYNYPDPYKIDTILAIGTRQDILDRLHEPSLVGEIETKIPRLKRLFAES